VGIAVLDVTGVGLEFCGGAIGKGKNKMCVATSCQVSSHLTNKITLNTGEHPTDKEFVFICSSTKRPMDTAAVFVKPCIPSSRLGTRLARYLVETRSVNAWETLFLHLASTFKSEAEDAEVEMIVTRCDIEMKGMKGMTPMKKRTKLTVSSPALEAGYEATIMPLDPDLGPDLLFMSNVRLGWKPLVSNLDTLATLVVGAKELVQQFSSVTEVELENLDYLNARLRAELGTRPEDWGTESAFEKLACCVKEIDELYGKLELLTKDKQDEIASRDAAIQTASLQVQQDMLLALQPVFELFGLMSTTKATPGDKYLDDLTYLKEELVKVKAAQALRPGTAAPAIPAVTRGVTWGLGSMNLAAPTPQVTQGTPVAQVMTPVLASRFKNVEESIRNIEAQLVSEQVEMGGVVFVSRAACKAWIKLEAPADIAYCFFLDPHAFLNVGNSGASNSVESLSLSAAAVKAGFSSSEEALVVSSFKFELPTFFGKDSKDSRKLPVMPTAEVWDSKDGFTGVRYEFRKLINSTRKEQLSNASLYLAGDGLIVAKQMIQASASFLETMETWISQQYNDLLGQGGSEKECWAYVCHCVREIFAALHEARLPGRGFQSSEERPVSVMWGALQAHKKVEELTKKQFSAHPLLSHVLNLHLRQHSVRKVDHEMLAAKVILLEAELSHVRKVADQALTLCKKKP
jgi:hypothetical protein